MSIEEGRHVGLVREVIDEHLQWLARRNTQPTRDLSEYPLVKWAAERRRLRALKREQKRKPKRV